jgi:cation transport regulator ChaB
MTRSKKPRAVCLSGKTRLTYREAFALMHAAYAGIEDLIDEQSERSLTIVEVAHKAIDKLKAAMERAGAWDDEGNIYDPFDHLKI